MANPKLYFAVAVCLFLVFVGLTGCDLRSAITVDTPPGVQKALGIEDATLATAPQVVADWNAYIESNSQQLGSSISAAESRYVALRSVADIGLQAAASGSATLPGGALILSVLTGLGGLFLNKPGTADAVRKEKEDSYNAGLEQGKELLDV